MNKLNDSTVKLIASCQVISNIEVLVKELVENSLDAGASRIFINLKMFGLDKIDVIDDGIGIRDMIFLSEGHCTSKIINFDDIENVKTFGFRGEVLSSICSVSNLSITSNCDAYSSSLGKIWVFDKLGNIIASSAIACKQGTTVSVTNIFQNLPVRRQIYRSLFVLQKTLKLITRYIQQLYLIKQNVQIQLSNDNNVILNFPQSINRKDSIHKVIGTDKCQLFGEICETSITSKGEQMKFNLFLPKYFDEKLGLNHSDYREACNLFINNRPAEVSSIFKTIKESCGNHTVDKKGRYPLCFVYIDLPPAWVDVNIDPDKRKIKLTNLPDVLHSLESHIESFYNSMPDRGEKSNTANIIQGNNVDIKIPMPTYIAPIKYLRPMRASNLEDEINDNSSVFTHSDNSSTDLDNSMEECSTKDGLNKYNNEVFKKPSSNYSLGRLHDIKGNPVQNVNLKRSIIIDEDNIEPPPKILKTESNKANKMTGHSIIKEVSDHHPMTAKLSVSSLTTSSLTPQKKEPKNMLTFLANWNAFIVALDEISKSNIDESSRIIIFDKRNLLTACTFAYKLREMQIPATKMDSPLLIDERFEELRKRLESLPLQLICNSSSGQKFQIISCHHLIKNGFRIHCLKQGDQKCFQIVSRPSFIDADSLIGEIVTITDHCSTSTTIVRTQTCRRWIYNCSQQITEQKMQTEVKELSSKTEADFWNKCLYNIKKYDVLNNEEFPDFIYQRLELKC